MATSALMSLGGQSKGSGAWNGAFATDNALFLKVFGGEVYSAFEKYAVTDGKHRVRSISSGKSAQFPMTGRNEAHYFTPGTDILEDSYQAESGGGTGRALGIIQVAEKVINIDDLLISTCIIDDLDLAKSHYDYRGPFSRELGRSLAFSFDSAVLNAAAYSATANESSSTVFETSQIIEGTVATSLAAITSKELIDSVYQAAQGFDEKYVPEDERYFFCRPREYNKLLLATDGTTSSNLGTSLVHRDYTGGGNGNLAENFIVKCAGMTVVKTPHLPQADERNSGGEWAGQNNNYRGDWSKTYGLAWHPEAVGTVKLKDVTMESEYLIQRQGTLMVAKMAVGHGGLRPECAAIMRHS